MSTILAISAHPDDETGFVGGTLVRYAGLGHDVYILETTRGEGGEVGEPPLTDKENLGSFREQEVRNAVRILGAKDIFFFTLPLSVGGYFLSISALILGAFIARAPDPERILPIYYLALGLVNPVAYAATRIQTIVLAFPPKAKHDRLTLRFSLVAGICLGLIPLLFILPGIIEIYYVTLQNLPPGDLPLVRMTALALVFFPLSVAIRAQSEGLSAWFKKPMTVLAGHAAFMGIIIFSGFTLLLAGTPGYLIGAVGLTLGSLASSIIMRVFLGRAKEKPIPVGQTTTSIGQIR